MPEFQLPPFRLIHCAYVAHSMEAGKRRLTAISGVSTFTTFTATPIPVPGGNAIIDIVIGNANGTTLETLCPMGGQDTVYRQVLPLDPDDIAFHHFASRLESAAEWDMVQQAAARNGIYVPVFCDAVGGTRFIYLDLRPRLGHMIEYLWSEDGSW
jgi:hypothetical protein